MDIKVKQRLVGALVLVGLVIILLPVVFHGNSINNKTIGASPIAAIPPPKPQVETLVKKQQKLVLLKKQHLQRKRLEMKPDTKPLSEKKLTLGQASLLSADQVKQKVSFSVAAKPKPVINNLRKNHGSTVALKASKPITHKTKQHTLPVAWAVQLATFRQKSNAVDLEKRLRKQGYGAYVKPARFKDNELYRVIVGSKASKSKANRLRLKLAQQTHLKGLVVHLNK